MNSLLKSSAFFATAPTILPEAVLSSTYFRRETSISIVTIVIGFLTHKGESAP